MQRYTYKNKCPCGEVPFKILYASEAARELYCPFCTIAIDTQTLPMKPLDAEDE